jgi:hypothetical protein
MVDSSSNAVNSKKLPWRRALQVSYPPVTEETGAMGREIESRQGSFWKITLSKYATLSTVKRWDWQREISNVWK